jgi:hypothetical protein
MRVVCWYLWKQTHSGIVNVLTGMGYDLRVLQAHAGKSGHHINHAVVKIGIHSASVNKKCFVIFTGGV